MGVWEMFCRSVKRSGVHPGQRVRIVEMDGCMATVRGKVREGVVQAVTSKLVYGTSTPLPYATILFNDGVMGDWCAEPRLWQPGEDGVMETLI